LRSAIDPLPAPLPGWFHSSGWAPDDLVTGLSLDQAQILADSRQVTGELPGVRHAMPANLLNDWVFHSAASNSSSGEQISGHANPAS
jgi:hypothetical protein